MFGEGGLAVYFRVSPFFVERFGGVLRGDTKVQVGMDQAQGVAVGH